MKNKVWSILAALAYFALGAMVLMWPVATVVAVVYFVGGFLLVGGIFLMYDAFKLPSEEGSKGFLLFDGVIVTILGALFLFGNTFIGAALLIYTLIIWFMFTSVMQIIVSVKMKSRWAIVTIILDLIVIALSVYALFNPLVAAGIFVWTIAFQFMFVGITKLLLSFGPTNGQTKSE